MNDVLLEVKNIHAKVAEKPILKGINLTIRKGETHLIMGPNGQGKSTLVSAIMGNPDYTVTDGSIILDGVDITHSEVDERARLGLFLSFQSPVDIPGVSLDDFIATAVESTNDDPMAMFTYRAEFEHNLETVSLNDTYAERFLNVGWSGGERKKSEIAQMLTLHPQLTMLDEIDSGLDVDAIKAVASAIESYRSPQRASLIISHNAEILSSLTVDFVHVINDGRIVRSGGPELATRIAHEGFSQIINSVQAGA